MQGSWRVSSLTTAGKRASAEGIKNARFAVKGNEYTYKNGEEFKGTFTLDPTGRPKQIDSKFVDESGKETGVARGIYELDGDLSWAETGSESRPKDFKSSKEAKNRVIVLERGK